MESVVRAALLFLMSVICVFSCFFQFGQRFINIDLFKEPAFGFVELLYWFPVFKFMTSSIFRSLISALNFQYLFSSAYLGFNIFFFFFCFLCWKLRLLILDLYSFLIYIFNAISFPLSAAFTASQILIKLYFYCHLVKNIFQFLLGFL